MLVAHQKVEPFIKMTASPILDYRRTAAVSFASFTLHETNKPLLVQAGAVMAMLALVVDDDLAIKRDAAFALSNISDSPELQGGKGWREHSRVSRYNNNIKFCFQILYARAY